MQIQPSVITPYELFPPKVKKKILPASVLHWARFLVQWSTLAGRICVSGTMAHQNLKRKWGVTMLLSELPRLELAKRWKMGFFGHTPPVHMKVYESHPVAPYSVRTAFRDNSVRTFSSETKKNPTSQCAPLDQFLVQWSTLAGRICVSGTMSQQNLKRKWGVNMLLSELPRLELAKRWKMGFFGHTPPCSYESV